MKAAKHNTGRLRRFSKWAGLVAVVLLIAAWIASGWVVAGIVFKGGNSLWIFCGRCSIWHLPTAPFDHPGPDMHRVAGGYGQLWAFWLDDMDWPEFRMFVPIWALVLAVSIPTAIVWRRDYVICRRVKSGACPHCAFNLSGLAPDAVCPECGKAR